MRPVKPATVWAREAEQRTLAQAEALLREARANARSLRGEPALLARLAAELAASRAAELTRVFRNLIWVLPGFRKRCVKSRAAAAATRERITDELCVLFVVRRKGSVAEGDAQHLPRWLIAYADHGGERLPVAVPTDVRDVSDYHAARAQAASAVWVRNGRWERDGSFVGLVRLVQPGLAPRVCMLSAMHVLRPIGPLSTAPTDGKLAVQPLALDGTRAATPTLANSLAVCGVLRSDQRTDPPSFDVQLAAADDEAALRARSPLRRWHAAQPYVRDTDELLALRAQGSFYLLTPDNHGERRGRGALRMALSTLPVPGFRQPVDYTFDAHPFPVQRDVFHAELLGFERTGSFDAAKVPLPGDSGSPIVALRDDGTVTLVAMHIGGTGTGLSWAIPAWALFRQDNWAQFPAHARIEPVDA